MTIKIVFVHGGWGSPSMWDGVVNALDPDLEAVCADLPTMSRADATLADDVAHVRSLMTGPQVIVCAHSYGGAVATEAGAGQPNVSHLVYLAAAMPDVGESMFDWGSKRPIPGTAPLEFRPDGTAMVPSWADDEDVYDRATLDRWAAIPPRPFAVAAAVTPMTAAAWREVPSTYVVASRDTVIHPDTQREAAARGATNVLEWDVGHMVNLALPTEIADLLGNLAHSST